VSRLYAVTLDPGNGPSDLFILEHDSAASISEVKNEVLKYLKSIDMNAITTHDLRIQDIGDPESITIFDPGETNTLPNLSREGGSRVLVISR